MEDTESTVVKIWRHYFACSLYFGRLWISSVLGAGCKNADWSSWSVMLLHLFFFQVVVSVLSCKKRGANMKWWSHRCSLIIGTNRGLLVWTLLTFLSTFCIAQRACWIGDRIHVIFCNEQMMQPLVVVAGEVQLRCVFRQTWLLVRYRLIQTPSSTPHPNHSMTCSWAEVAETLFGGEIRWTFISFIHKRFSHLSNLYCHLPKKSSMLYFPFCKVFGGNFQTIAN